MMKSWPLLPLRTIDGSVAMQYESVSKFMAILPPKAMQRPWTELEGEIALMFKAAQ